MHWILQENIYGEIGYGSLIQILERTNTPHTFVKVISFIGETIPDINIKNPVVCFGQYSIRNTAKKKGWTPGVWNLNDIDYDMCIKYWGKEMLNFDLQIFALKDFEKTVTNTEDAFFRPAGDNKHFSGGIHTYNYIKGLKETALLLKEDEIYYGLLPETKIIRSSIKEIYSEYRTWIINGELITSSQYKIGDKVLYSPLVDDEILEYAKSLIKIWQPSQAFVLDICKTKEGLRAIEINTINAAGFYAADMFKIFKAIEDFNGC